MSTYKRNQVEDAIALAMGNPSRKAVSEMRTRVKRLLDTDRKLRRSARSSDPERSNYAFYSTDLPGKGFEISFSEYEAFALLTALRMLNHNWPQGFAVSTLRGVRPELEARHRCILRLDPSVLFSVVQDTSPGSVPQTNNQPEFLLIVSDSDERDVSGSYARLFKDQVSAFKFQLERSGRSCTWLELVTPAFVLRRYLQEVEPRKRGRSG